MTRHCEALQPLGRSTSFRHCRNSDLQKTYRRSHSLYTDIGGFCGNYNTSYACYFFLIVPTFSLQAGITDFFETYPPTAGRPLPTARKTAENISCYDCIGQTEANGTISDPEGGGGCTARTSPAVLPYRIFPKYKKPFSHTDYMVWFCFGFLGY